LKGNIYIEVMSEQIKQVEKHGEQNHPPFTYLSILTEEVGEAAQAANDAYDFVNDKFTIRKLTKYRNELIQVAAVAVSMVEVLDRQMEGK
jgi:NTP pyrophosphatase (non-canonical NTP hydrolase)